MIKQDQQHTFEYLQSLKVINKMTTVMLYEVTQLIGDMKQIVCQQEKELSNVILPIANTHSDIINVMKQTSVLMKLESIEKQLFINMVASLTELICEMLKNIENAKIFLERMDATHSFRLQLKYQLDYLSCLLTELIIVH
ncbi:hypothetical protein KDJ21_002515 [Metabacillus litoralis]|uniref:hypothetical protein n=1 Tax=Metabacillus litoralis TaxID=152268 RepID=UPI001BA1C83F|nr:hypothetical protein [Metabacillus litoralis]UHA60625.1 hypothetical protein KDJ21_002515 [Metabacillus litoralis]